MAVHQGGKVCLLSLHDAEQFEKYGIVPKCIDHRHLRRAAAEVMVQDRSLRRVRVVGPDRYVWVRAQHWKAVRGAMQLVDGDIAGRAGRLRYRGIEALGAHTRRQSVGVINVELTGDKLMNLRELRRMAGLTQWQLAQRCGVSRMRISLAECGQLELRQEEEAGVRSVLLDAIKGRESKIRSVLSGGESVAV